MNSPAHCDCCDAPMANMHHRSADLSPGIETTACVLCTYGSRDEVIDEIEALGDYIACPGVADRIVRLADSLEMTNG